MIIGLVLNGTIHSEHIKKDASNRYDFIACDILLDLRKIGNIYHFITISINSRFNNKTVILNEKFLLLLITNCPHQIQRVDHPHCLKNHTWVWTPSPQFLCPTI